MRANWARRNAFKELQNYSTMIAEAIQQQGIFAEPVN
jgi:hypothetical protein